jgi:CHASE2 domain-containing sensor protein
MTWLYLVVFLTDAAIDFLAIKLQLAITNRNRRMAMLCAASLNIVIGINSMGFVKNGWLSLVPSALGAIAGVNLGLTRKAEKVS